MTQTIADYDRFAADLEQDLLRHFAEARVLRYGAAVRRHQAALADDLWYVELPAQQELITIGVTPVYTARAGGSFGLQVKDITSEARADVEAL